MTMTRPPGTLAPDGLLAVITTTATRDDAVRLAHILVERRLAACAQISAIESVYVWAGALQHEPEHRLVLKTTVDRHPALEAALAELHPYALPAIVSLPFDAGEAYGAWVRASVAA